MNLRTWASPKILLGFFLANTLFLAWLTSGQARLLALTAVLVEAALGLFLFSRLSAGAKEADDALDRADHYIQGVADLSLDVQSIINAQHQSYLYMNSAVEKVLGYKSEEFIEGGLDFFYSILHPEDLPQVRRELERMMAPGLSARADERIQEEIYRVRNKWDEYRWFRSRRMVFTRTEGGAPRDLLVVARDITEQRGFELALVQAQEYESLGILARRLAHDLNNILMGIQGYVELGQDGKGLPPETQEKIREGTGRATEICRQMLAFAGRGRLQPLRHQLNDALREGLPVVESLLPENIQLVLELEPDLPKVNADPNQIRYALLNLVVNAMETLGTREGEIVVRTGLKHLHGDPALAGCTGDFVCLEVQDSGSGMSEDTLAGVSEPFFRLKHPGKGLGLLTVKGIAEEHHGVLHVESVQDKGTHCRLYLPVAGAEVLADEGEEGTPITAAGGVVLLVDDEPTIRAVLSQGLERAGYTVIEAVDGVDGFGAFVRHRSAISVVLLDLTMPRMNGDEVFAEIRKLAPEVPVILMSGYSQSEATQALSERGPAAFLSKPCTIKEALATVHKVLDLPRQEPA